MWAAGGQSKGRLREIPGAACGARSANTALHLLPGNGKRYAQQCNYHTLAENQRSCLLKYIYTKLNLGPRANYEYKFGVNADSPGALFTQFSIDQKFLILLVLHKMKIEMPEKVENQMS